MVMKIEKPAVSDIEYVEFIRGRFGGRKRRFLIHQSGGGKPIEVRPTIKIHPRTVNSIIKDMKREQHVRYHRRPAKGKYNPWHYDRKGAPDLGVPTEIGFNLEAMVTNLKVMLN